MKYLLYRASVIFLLIAIAGSVFAQTYPVRPVRVIVPSQAGGPTDVVARYYADLLSKELGQAFFIENRVGAGGNVGTALAAKAPPDGYTLVVGNAATHAMNSTFYANPGFDAEKDFIPIGMLGLTSVAIAVTPKLGVKTLPELIAKSKAAKIDIALPSTTAVVIQDYLARQGKWGMLGVPYKGAPAAWNDVLGGHVDAIIDTASFVQQQVSAGKMVGIAVASLGPSDLLPGVKSIADQGFPGFEVAGWFVLFAPRGTPRDIIVKLNTSLKKVRDNPASRNQLFAIGLDAVPVGELEQLPEFIRTQNAKWGELVKAANIRAE